MTDKRRRINLNDMAAVRREMARVSREAKADGQTSPRDLTYILKAIQSAIFNAEFEERLRRLEEGTR